jgi:hypothetical protein
MSSIVIYSDVADSTERGEVMVLLDNHFCDTSDKYIQCYYDNRTNAKVYFQELVTRLSKYDSGRGQPSKGIVVFDKIKRAKVLKTWNAIVDEFDTKHKGKSTVKTTKKKRCKYILDDGEVCGRSH